MKRKEIELQLRIIDAQLKNARQALCDAEKAVRSLNNQQRDLQYQLIGLDYQDFLKSGKKVYIIRLGNCYTMNDIDEWYCLETPENMDNWYQDVDYNCQAEELFDRFNSMDEDETEEEFEERRDETISEYSLQFEEVEIEDAEDLYYFLKQEEILTSIDEW